LVLTSIGVKVGKRGGRAGASGVRRYFPGARGECLSSVYVGSLFPEGKEGKRKEPGA